ncbi:MAG: ABC transporter substrate-binding protein [Thermomicrobiales bacterium]|nr:ABC transporter substrate-binding protein [Thermomicrobiales bacterium]MCO5222221.1 ABC transporter substrate-binding protein [Thermomicrobiales bacterium]
MDKTHDLELNELRAAIASGRMSRRAALKRAAALGLSLSGAVALISEAGVSSVRAQDAPSGTLVIGNAEPPTSAQWDSYTVFGLVDAQVASLVHDSLLGYDSADGAIVGHLATAWEMTDPTTMRLTLREGVTFHDGSPVTAEDVKATLDRVGSPDSGLAWHGLIFPNMSVNIVDPTTIEVVTEEVFGPLEKSLAVAPIFPAGDIADPALLTERAIGAGPYKWISYDENKVTLEANTDYWAGAPGIQTVVFEYIQDANARISALLTGQVDIITRCSSEQLDRVEDDDNFYVVDVPPLTQILCIYQNNGQLANQEIRQALAYAIDRQAIVDGILMGVGKVPFSAIATNAPGYQEQPERFDFDPEKARELLAAAGVGEDFTLTMATSTLVPHQKEIDQAIAQFLQDVGINVDITTLEVGAFRTSYNQYDLTLNTLASFNYDPDFVLGFYAGPTAEAVFNLNDPAIPPMIDAQRSSSGEERLENINELAAYLWDGQVSLYLSDELWPFIVSSKVQNYDRVPVVGEPLLRLATKSE